MALQDTHSLLTGGMEKTLRVYDMNRPDAEPRELDKSPGSIRTVAWLHSDQTILSSCSDMGGVRCVCAKEVPQFNNKHVY
jgi:serine-threonine kinase receptor-associated protein